MAESSTQVRLLQHHLRQAGMMLSEGQLDAASSHLDAALAIDPASLAALALRETRCPCFRAFRSERRRRGFVDRFRATDTATTISRADRDG